MNEFRFAAPEWIHAFWAVLALVILLVAMEFRGKSLLDQFVTPLLQEQLVYRLSMSRRLISLAFLGICLGCIAIALMRPQWGMRTQKISRVDSRIMICLDLSKSMLTQDIVPNRLDRAKAEVDSLLSILEEGQQVGLLGFAGRARVLCPMTTDFGFLRMIMAEASPSTVGLGGTKIGEAIRLASDGFTQTGDVNRLILLITDGEDHESFPLDAAEKAREKGIRIVSVGFGDELGSKIEFTDPETGIRSFVKDREGNDVLSALDGETLREIAMTTEGAYIPAGVGALDLQSIYDDHIKSMLEGTDSDEERIIRNEAFQWCLLAALVSLVLCVLTRASYLRNTSARSRLIPGAVAACLFTLFVPANQTFAQSPLSPAPNATEPVAADTADPTDSAENQTSKTSSEPNFREVEQSPRELYNAATNVLLTNPDRAEELLVRARNEAGVDGELRYRTLFNMSWVEVARSDKLLESEPENALQHLELAAGRMQEAIRIRPESEDARHNLEVLMQRILELRDSIRQQSQSKLEDRLDALIEQERGHQIELQQISAQVQFLNLDVADFREQFRKLGITQRRILSDAQQLQTECSNELESLKKQIEDSTATPGQTAEPDPRIRASQIAMAMRYLDRASQKLARARSYTRRSQADRAFVRWASALTETKRARDQLRNPAEILGVLISDASLLEGQLIQSAQLNSTSQNLPDTTVEDSSPDSSDRFPIWLQVEHLSEQLLQQRERTEELAALFSAILAGASEEDEDAASPQDNAELASQLDAIQGALPFLNDADKHFQAAHSAIEKSSFDSSLTETQGGIEDLKLAAEFFFDIRRLLEAMYASEMSIGNVLESKQLPAIEEPPKYLFELQKQNLERVPRLVGLLSKELESVNSKATEQPTPQNAGGDEENPEKQRLEIAMQLAESLRVQMVSADSRFQELLASPPPPEEERPPSPLTTFQPEQAQFLRYQQAAPNQEVESSIEILEQLRRLFFSLIEHLRDTARRQAELNDETISAYPANSPTHEQFPAFAPRQTELKEISQQISKALEEQSAQIGAQGAQPPGQQPGAQEAGQNGENMAEAANLVAKAAEHMQTAEQEIVKTLESEQTNSKELTEKSEPMNSQREALLKLLEALQLLDDQQNDQQQNQDQQNDQNEQDQQQDQQDSQPQNEETQNMNSEQMLQAIREREAERRKNKGQPVVASGSVDKDW